MSACGLLGLGADYAGVKQAEYTKILFMLSKLMVCTAPLFMWRQRSYCKNVTPLSSYVLLTNQANIFWMLHVGLQIRTLHHICFTKLGEKFIAKLYFYLIYLYE